MNSRPKETCVSAKMQNLSGPCMTGRSTARCRGQLTYEAHIHISKFSQHFQLSVVSIGSVGCVFECIIEGADLQREEGEWSEWNREKAKMRLSIITQNISSALKTSKNRSKAIHRPYRRYTEVTRWSKSDGNCCTHLISLPAHHPASSLHPAFGSVQ